MRLTKPLLAWSLYDWASSPVPTLHATFIFSVFFTTAVMPEGGSVAWAWMTAATAFLLAIAAPVFGRMADQRGNAKSFLGLMVLLGGTEVLNLDGGFSTSMRVHLGEQRLDVRPHGATINAVIAR